jgi:cation:H+ antiporter
MPSFVAVLIFVVGAGVSLVASALLVSRLEQLGHHWGLSGAFLGLIAALAADGPEVTSAVSALAQHNHAVSVGVLLGSNVFNLAALLGVGALVAGRLALHPPAVIFEGLPAVLAAALGVAVVAGLPAWIGLGLAAAVLIPYAVLSATSGRSFPLPPGSRAWVVGALTAEGAELDRELGRPCGRPRRSGAEAVGCLLVVIAASTVTERVATTLGRRWSLPDLVVGAVVLAAVTSVPNAVAAVHLARRRYGAAVLSEALNSNTINVVAGLLIPAVVAGVGAVSAQSTVVALWALVMTGGAVLAAWRLAGVDRRVGWSLVAVYLAFVILLIAW